jgi:thiol-disulfide isomerase/thioredoxin
MTYIYNYKMSVTEVTTLQEFNANILQEATHNLRFIVVDCYAPWCGPCKRFAPIFSDFSRKYPTCFFMKVDVDVVQEVSEKYNVNSLPCFMFFDRKNNQVLTRATEDVVGFNIKGFEETLIKLTSRSESYYDDLEEKNLTETLEEMPPLETETSSDDDNDDYTQSTQTTQATQTTQPTQTTQTTQTTQPTQPTQTTQPSSCCFTQSTTTPLTCCSTPSTLPPACCFTQSTTAQPACCFTQSTSCCPTQSTSCCPTQSTSCCPTQSTSCSPTQSTSSTQATYCSLSQATSCSLSQTTNITPPSCCSTQASSNN